MAPEICRIFEMQVEARADWRAAPMAGMRTAARMPMMAMTVRSSTRVKACLRPVIDPREGKAEAGESGQEVSAVAAGAF
jgi:hypothetical protein